MVCVCKWLLSCVKFVYGQISQEIMGFKNAWRLCIFGISVWMKRLHCFSVFHVLILYLEVLFTKRWRDIWNVYELCILYSTKSYKQCTHPVEQPTYWKNSSTISWYLPRWNNIYHLQTVEMDLNFNNFISDINFSIKSSTMYIERNVKNLPQNVFKPNWKVWLCIIMLVSIFSNCYIQNYSISA